MQKRFIPVAAPVLGGNEKKYVLDCLETTWISSIGKYVQAFESEFAKFCGVEHATACCNGTVALHLALLALGIGPGDEVIVPAMTYVASANVVKYCGAQPVFVDSEPRAWNIDSGLIEEKITSRTRAIMPVHLYGYPADMDPIMSIARRHGLYVIEDAAEAHGAEYKGRKVGSIGDVGIFSFYGNKVITTGEGGMVLTNDDRIAQRAQHLKAQGVDPNKRYWHTAIGYNYRMTNVTAAIGLAQLERISEFLNKRDEVAGWYRDDLADAPVEWQQQEQWARPIHWMVNVLVNEDQDRDEIMRSLAELGIETRPVFYPIHVLPPYQADELSFPVAERVGRSGISLPTWFGLTRDDVRYVTENFVNVLSRVRQTI